MFARALLREGRYRRVVSEFGGPPSDSVGARADIGTSLAIAYLNLGDRNNARTSINKALTANPKSVRARVVQARLTAQENDLPQAQKLVDDVLVDKPGDIDAMLLKSEMHSRRASATTRIATLERAIETTPGTSGAGQR